MDSEGVHAGLIYKIKIKSYCEVIDSLEVPLQFHSLDFSLDMPGGHFRRSAHDEKNMMQVGERRHAGCPRTSGNAWVRITENFDVTAYGKLEIFFDVVNCFISSVSSALSYLLNAFGLKMEAYLKIEGSIGLEGLDEKRCGSETCDRSALSTRIGSISKTNAFFKGEGTVRARLESSFLGSFELRASLYFDLVGTLFCTGCRAAAATDQASFVGIHMDAEFYYTLDPPLGYRQSGTTLVNVFPEMWVDKPEECGRTTGLFGEDVYNFIEAGSSPMSYTIRSTACQTAYNGRYTYIQDANGRPAFKHDSKNKYIVYNSYYSSWYVSSSLSASTFNMKILSTEDYPPSSGWYEWCIESWTGLGYSWYSTMRVTRN
jgi:hypothetical protein